MRTPGHMLATRKLRAYFKLFTLRKSKYFADLGAMNLLY